VPRTSIIVTSFNIESYIGQCLDSVLGQTLRDIEVIVVDDGSTDGTPSIIEQYATDDPRVVPVLLPANSIGGVATAANAGLDRVSAPYVGFMDGDDYCEPTMFQLLVDAAERHDADLAMCSYRVVDTSSGDVAAPPDSAKWSYLDSDHYALDAETRGRLLEFNAVPWRKLYRTAMLESNRLRFPVGDYFYEDNPFHWFTILSARSIALVPEVLCYHRVQREGQSMAVADARLLRIFDHHWTIHSFLVDRDLLDLFAPHLISWVIRQASWVAGRTPPELRRDLFDRLHAIFDAYEPYAFREGLIMYPRGERVTRLVRSARRDNFVAFARSLEEDHEPSDEISRSTSPTAQPRLARQLRASQLREAPRRLTALARRRRRPTPSPPEPVAVIATSVGADESGVDASIDSTDLMFGLMVLQRRLSAVENDIREMRAAVARLETVEEDESTS
jgi:glycosyltransferase involved in cell wall biosynthesis